MADTFDRELDSRIRTQRRWNAVRFVLAACLDDIHAGLGERRRRRRSGLAGAGVLAFGACPRDFIHAVRSLAKARAFTLVCVVSFGVGMGTVIAILLFMRAVFRPPMGVDPRGLVELVITPVGQLRAEAGGGVTDTWSYPDFVEVREADTGMAVTGWSIGASTLRLPDGGGAARVATMFVSSNYFTIVGAGLWRGAGFDPALADAANAPSVVVVGHRFWQNRLGGDPAIVGRTITLNRVEHVIAGVAAERFRGHVSPENGPDIDLWAPLRQHPRLQPGSSENAVGVLGAEVRVDAADREVHPREAPRRVVRLLAEDADIAHASAVRLDELLALHEHAARPAARVEHASLVGREHFDEHLDDAAGRVELASLLPLGRGELREEVLVDAAEDVFRAVIRVAEADRADQVDQLTQPSLVEARTRVFLRQYALERRVVALDGDHRLVDGLADGGLLRLRLKMPPARFLRHPEDVVAARSSV